MIAVARLALAGTPMEFRPITDIEDLWRLAPAWRELQAQGPVAEPMASPEWASRWWRFYGDPSFELRAGAFLEKGQLVGLAPLLRRRHRYRGGLTFRRLEFLGSDVEEHDGVCSEYLGILHRPDRREAVAGAFVHFLKRGGFGAWDEIVLANMNGQDPFSEILARNFEAHDLPGILETSGEAPYLELPPTWEAFLKALPKSRRYDFRNDQKKFDEWADGTACLHEARTPEELQRGRAVLHLLHEQRWSEAGHAGAFASARFAGFHDAWMAHLLAEGRLELLWLTVRDEPVAVLYAFRFGSKVYFYQSGRTTAVPDKVRPGVVLLGEAVRRAMARGLKEFDFLAGPAHYKLQFTRTLRPLTTFRAARATPVEYLRRSLGQLRKCWRLLGRRNSGTIVNEG